MFQNPSLLQFSHLRFVLGWWDFLLHWVPIGSVLYIYLWSWSPLTSLWSLLNSLYDPKALAVHTNLSSRHCSLQSDGSTGVPAGPTEYPWLHSTRQHLSWLWHVRISVFQYRSQSVIYLRWQLQRKDPTSDTKCDVWTRKDFSCATQNVETRRCVFSLESDIDTYGLHYCSILT